MGTAYDDEMRRRQTIGVRLSYLNALLPEELRRDPTAAAVANHFARQDNFSVEGRLVEMVRALVKVGDSLRQEHIKMLEQHGLPRMRFTVPPPSESPNQ